MFFLLVFQCCSKCCYSVLSLLSTAAFICGLSSYAFCDFVERYVTLRDNEEAVAACESLGTFTGPFDKLCQNLVGTHSVGFEGFYVPSDQTCFSYLQMTPSGYQEPPLDTKFNSARALSITANVVGGAAWYVTYLVS
jgi:hypothetical protein